MTTFKVGYFSTARNVGVTYSFSALTMLVGRQEGHLTCKKLGVRFLMVSVWSFARLVAPAVTTTSIIISSNEIQNVDVLVPANPDTSGKWPLTRRERNVGMSGHQMGSEQCKKDACCVTL